MAAAQHGRGPRHEWAKNSIAVFCDADGNPIRRVRQARFKGTLCSEDLSRSVPYGGRIHRVEDFVEGTNTVTPAGLRRLPGPDPAVTGREVVDLETFETIFRSGRPPAKLEARVRAYFVLVRRELTVPPRGAFASNRGPKAPRIPGPVVGLPMPLGRELDARSAVAKKSPENRRVPRKPLKPPLRRLDLRYDTDAQSGRKPRKEARPRGFEPLTFGSVDRRLGAQI
jgi:hypothetical protein